MSEQSIDARLASIQAYVKATNEMLKKEIGALQNDLWGNGKEGLRTIAVAHQNRILELERAGRDRSDVRHNYGLVAVAIALSVLSVCLALALLKALEIF